MRGEAHDLTTGALLYTEEHRERQRDGRSLGTQVTYRAPDGELLVEKWVVPRTQPWAPSYEWLDLRHGRREAALPEGERIALAWSEGQRARRNDALLDAASTVVDIGIQAFIEEHWQGLLAGETLELEIPVPERLALYNFRLRRTGDSANRGPDTETLELVATSFLVRLALDPIRFIYSIAEQRLVELVGRTGIADAAGRPIIARVLYSPPVFEADRARLPAAD